jgi:hypothetical protein
VDPNAIPPVVRTMDAAYVAVGLTTQRGKRPKRSAWRRLRDRLRRRGSRHLDPRNRHAAPPQADQPRADSQ